MFKKILKSYDYSLIIVVILLSLFGLIMVYSSSMVTAIYRYETSSDYFFQKQKLHLVFAAFVFIFFALFPYKAWMNKRIQMFLWAGSIGALAILFIIGHTAGGAQSWIKLGTSSLQPSEFVKLSVILYLSAAYAKKQNYINEFNTGIAPPIVYLVIVCGLIAIQPDFGTAIIIFAIAATIIMSSGISFKNVIKLMTIGLVFIIPVLIFMKDEIFSEKRLARFEVLKDPFAEELVQGSSYQLVNSYIAIASGKINGLGLGQSIQKLGYLPDSHTDFIMAIISEELGIWGVGFVILSLAFIVIKGLVVARNCKDPFGSLLAIGISSMIGIQSGINLTGITGLVPLMGVPLPFVSYGGSSLLQLSIAIGLLANISMFVNYERKYKKQKTSSMNDQRNNIQQKRTNYHLQK